MTSLPPLSLEMADLLEALCLEELSPADAARLEDLVRSDTQCCRQYIFFMQMHALVERFGGEGRGTRSEGRGMAGLPAIDLPVGAEVGLPHQPESRIPSPEPPGSPFPSLSTTHYPLPTTPFVGSWAFSYMVATVILGVAILGFWAYKITRHQHIAEAPSQSAPSEAMPEMVFVGRITGMVDVKWSDDPRYLPPPGFAHVPLGRKYILSSGLMEITYDSGAKVILEGPCTYEVESTAGGYLSLGKLTARVETRGEGRGARGEDVPHSPLSPLPSPLFSVRTPTAVITDLGTEFGVEVSEEGTTESRVFRGSVRVLVLDGDGNLPSPSGRGAGGESSGQVVVLRANESARVEGGGEPRITVLGASAKTADFTRGIPKVTYKTLDLVDVVAGGDGFSGRRDRGIDPTSGRIIDAQRSGQPAPMTGDGQYHRVEGIPLIDGVFIPDGGKDAVQVDSAGHTFAEFPDTFNATWQHIWAGGSFRDGMYRSIGAGYSSPGHGLVVIYANNAITFDLEAIRRANPGARLLRFRAKAVNAGVSTDGLSRCADVWVLVDGQSRFKRLRLSSDDAVSILVPIDDKDRFLTLASTDGGDAIGADWIFFGDPRLHLMLIEANEPKDKGGEAMNGP